MMNSLLGNYAQDEEDPALQTLKGQVGQQNPSFFPFKGVTGQSGANSLMTAPPMESTAPGAGPKPQGGPPAPMGPQLPDPEQPSNAFRNALLAGSQAASQAPAYDSPVSTLVSTLAKGIQGGAQQFTATRDAEKDRSLQMAAQQRFRQGVQGLVGKNGFTQENADYINTLPMDEANKIVSKLLEPDKLISVAGVGGVRERSGQVDAPISREPKSPSNQVELTIAAAQEADPNGPMHQAYAMGMKAPKPPMDMSLDQKGIAASINLDPSKVDEWSEADRKRFYGALYSMKSAPASVTVAGVAPNQFHLKVLTDLGTSQTDAILARQSIERNNRDIALLNGGAYTGSAAGARQALGTFLGTQDAANTAQVIADRAQSVIQNLPKNAPRSNNMLTLEKAARGGNMSDPVAALKSIMAAENDVLQQKIDLHSARLQSRAINDDERQTYELPPVRAPQPAGGNTPKDGEVVNGYKYHADHGRWEKLP